MYPIKRLVVTSINLIEPRRHEGAGIWKYYFLCFIEHYHVALLRDPSCLRVLVVQKKHERSECKVSEANTVPCLWDCLTINPGTSGARELQILDVSGRIIHQQIIASNSQNIRFSHLPSGTYVLQLIKGEMKWTYKIVKE